MIKLNNKIIAEDGKYLLYKGTTHKSLTIGDLYIFDGLNVNLVNISKDDIKEVYPVLIYNDVYYISSTDYAGIVSELIRLKYSLDDELALIANARIGKTSGEDEFLSWRTICKLIAKKITNE